MADYYINIFMNDEKQKKLEAAGLAGHIKDVDGKKAIQVDVSAKEQKKLIKGFPDLVLMLPMPVSFLKRPRPRFWILSAT